MKIFDCIKFFNEFEILDLRFMTLYDHVDYFVIVEANKTHTGKPKEFHLETKKEQYAKYWDKVICVYDLTSIFFILLIKILIIQKNICIL